MAWPSETLLTSYISNMERWQAKLKEDNHLLMAIHNLGALILKVLEKKTVLVSLK